MVGTGLDFDAVLELCGDQHRRIVLAVLAEEQRSLTLNDLTKTIVKYNHQMPATEASNEVLTQTRLSLHHVHVPKLESAGIVEYDPERQNLEPTKQFGQLQPYLSAIVDIDPDLEAPVEL